MMWTVRRRWRFGRVSFGLAPYSARDPADEADHEGADLRPSQLVSAVDCRDPVIAEASASVR
jgi:hypothetical protein